MSDKPGTLKVGIIGCGRMGRKRAERFLADQRTTLVALADSTVSAATALHDELQLDAATFEDAASMFNECELDAVAVCSPPRYHYEQTLLALKHGLHVLCEPPGVLEPLQAARLVKETLRQKLVFTVANDRRTEPVYKRIKEELRSGRLGAVRAVTGHSASPWLPSAVGTWRANSRMNPGGYLSDVGASVLDVLLFVTELNPTEVLAEVNLSEEANIEVSARVTAQLQAVPAQLTFQGNSSKEAENFFLHCERGVVVLHEGSLKITVDGKLQTVQLEPASENNDVVTAFLNTVLEGAPNLAGPEEALRVCWFLDAIFKSAESGESVKIKTL